MIQRMEMQFLCYVSGIFRYFQERNVCNVRERPSLWENTDIL